MADNNQATNGQSKVTPIAPPIQTRTVDTAKATQVVDGGERMPNPESQAAKDARQAKASKPQGLSVVTTAMDFSDRWGMLFEDDKGNLALVSIEPVTKARLGTVSVVDKKGQAIPPKANWNMSAFGRVSIDLGEDRESRLAADQVGAMPMLFSPASIYSPASQYEIANAKNNGSPAISENEPNTRKVRKVR